MGMYDYVVVLDEVLRCPHGHQVDGFQTKSFDNPSMDTYLFNGPDVHLVARAGLDAGGDGAAARWQLRGNEAVYRRRHAVSPVVPPGEIVFYATCDECAPVLVQSASPRAWGDFVDERQLWVEFRGTFGTDQPRYIERTSGTREDLVDELREDGLRIMRDDEPLATAHRDVRVAPYAGPPDASLLDVLIDGFERNEVPAGFHLRELPLPDEDTAVRKFASLSDEARQWKGTPDHVEESRSRRLASWPDLEIRQAGSGVLIRVRSPFFVAWWHDERTWRNDPLRDLHAWVDEAERPARRSASKIRGLHLRNPDQPSA